MSTRRGRGRGRGSTQAASNRDNISSRGRGVVQPTRTRGRGARTSTQLPPRAPTSRLNANINPTEVLKKYTITRRTSEQVQEAKQKAADADAAVKEAEDIAERERIQRVAEAEDNLRKEDLEYTKHAARPDLQSKSPG